MQTGLYIVFFQGAVTDTESPQNFPDSYSLGLNYPNPFNLTTTITYTLPERGSATLIIYDILWRQVRTLLDRVQEADRIRHSGMPATITVRRWEADRISTASLQEISPRHRRCCSSVKGKNFSQ